MGTCLSVREIRPFFNPSTVWTNSISQPIGAVIAAICLRLGLTPNVVTSLNLVVSAFAVWLYAVNPGSRWDRVCVGLLLQLAYAADTADGAVARITRTSTRFGGWYDVVVDRLCNAVVIGGLAVVRWPLVQATEDGRAYFATWIGLLSVTLVHGFAIQAKPDCAKSSPGAAWRNAGPVVLLRTVGNAICDYSVLTLTVSLGLICDCAEVVVQAYLAIRILALAADIVMMYVTYGRGVSNATASYAERLLKEPARGPAGEVMPGVKS